MVRLYTLFLSNEHKILLEPSVKSYMFKTMRQPISTIIKFLVIFKINKQFLKLTNNVLELLEIPDSS